MITTKKIKLLEAWKDNPFKELSLSEVIGILGKKTKPWVFNSLKVLVKNKLVKMKKKGNINLYRLNLKNPLLIQTLQYVESQKNLNFPELDLITEIINRVPVKNYCLIVFGSYAGGKQKKSSDLDICFLVEKRAIEKKIKPHFNEIKLNYTVGVDEHYITFEEFKKMLLREEENLGKQIFRKHILFFNAAIYYQLIKGAYQNGFRP